MFRKSVTIVLIFSILGLLVRFSVPYLWYYSNFHYIAEELCVNRHNPNSDCNASCQLKKMVEHHSDDHDAHQGKTTLPNEVRTYVSLFCQQQGTYTFSENPGIRTLSSCEISLKSQYIKQPSTPPPISTV